MLCLLCGLWLINLFDLILTVLAHQQGFLYEANPVAMHMLEQGPVALILFKTLFVWAGSYPLYRYRTTRIAEMAVLVVLFIYISVALRWSLCYELYHLSATETIPLAELNALLGHR